MGYELVGQVWSPAAFAGYVQTLDLSWAKGVTIHHTASPSLEQRPSGLTAQHMENLRFYYETELGWSSGPHLFISDQGAGETGQIWGMSSLERRGVHAKSFNATHIGIEVLGNYDSEDHLTGRGAKCWETTAYATRAIIDARGLTTDEINGHRDDPKTSKTCPGAKIEMQWFVDMVEDIDTAPGDRVDDPNEMVLIKRSELTSICDAIDWQLSKLRGY